MQGVYDFPLDGAFLKCSLEQLFALATTRANPRYVSSLVYVVFVLRRRITGDDNTPSYTRYWVVRVNLVDNMIETFDSYAEFDTLQDQRARLKVFLDEVWPNLRISNRAVPRD